MSKSKLKQGVKYDTGKEKYDLIPVLPLRELAKVYTFGAQKYEKNNWRKGMDWSRTYAAIQRHLNAFWSGEDIDPESGLHHLAHASFGCFSLVEYSKTQKKFDDRYLTRKAKVHEGLHKQKSGKGKTTRSRAKTGNSNFGQGEP